MKKLIVFFTTALLLTSCTAVKFENSQPSDSPSLLEFPAKMQGLFVSNNNDTLHIKINSFRYASGTEVFLEAELPDSKAVLKKLNQTYILSLKDESGWDVFPLKVSGNQIIAYYASLDVEAEQLIFELKKTSPVKEILNKDGNFDHYLIAPTEKEFRKLLRKELFSDKVTFKKLK